MAEMMANVFTNAKRSELMSRIQTAAIGRIQ